MAKNLKTSDGFAVFPTVLRGFDFVKVINIFYVRSLSKVWDLLTALI